MTEPSFQISQDMRWERRCWIIQRAGWFAMLLIVIAGALGLLGHGPLSRKTLASPRQDFIVQYERFNLLESPTEIRVELKPAQIQQDRAHVWIEKDFIDKMDVEKIVPEPQQVEVGEDRVVYTFQALSPSEPVTAWFHLKPRSVGKKTGRIGTDDGWVQFRQFTYP